MDENYAFQNKNEQPVFAVQDQQEGNPEALLHMDQNFTADTAKQIAREADNVTKDAQKSGMDKLSEKDRIRLREMQARSSAANLLYNQGGFDSAEMSRIKYCVEGVEQFLALNREEEVNAALLDELDTRINMAVLSCMSYINNPKKRENDRKANVRMAYRGMLFELSRITVLRKELKEGKLEKKKFSDLYLTIKGEIPKAKYYKKPAADKTIGSKARQTAKLFSYSFDPYKLLQPLQDKPEERKKVCKTYRYIRDTLRGFPKNRACAADLQLNGANITILQKPDNTLYVVDNNIEKKMDLTADVLIDRIESEMLEHEEDYGEYAARSIFLEINPKGKDMTPADLQRINSLCIAYIRKKTEVPDNDYGNVSAELLFKWARGLALGILTPEKVQQEYTRIEGDLLMHVNDRATTEMKNKISKEQAAQKVKIWEGEEEYVSDVEKRWSSHEKPLIDMIADIFFDSDTMNADDMVDQDVDDYENMRKRLGKHGDAFAAAVEDPSILENLVDRLPLPDIMMEDDDGEKVTIKQYMKDSFVSVFESDEIGFIKNWGLTGVLVAAFKAPNLDFVPDFAYKRVEAVLAKVTETMRQMAFMVTSKLQDVARGIADETFSEKKDDPMAQAPDTLDGMMDHLTRGGAAQSRFNKEIMYNYFKDSSFMDKRAMMASMVRNAKPEKALIPSDVELMEELREKPEYKRMFTGSYLTWREKQILDDYRHKRTQENVCVNLLGGMLKGSGPLMQKMVQGLPEAILPKEMVEAIKDMKSNLNPIPPDVVQLKMAAIVEGSGGTIEKIDVKRTLGAASIGQAFLCDIYGKNFPRGKEVVIKLLRSDARNRMQREAKMMKRYAKKADPSGSVLKSYQGQLREIMKELDMMREAKNIKDGAAFDEKLPDVESMKMNNIANPGADYIILEVAEGDTVDRYLKRVEQSIEEAKEPFYEKKKVDGKMQVNRKKYDFRYKDRYQLQTNVDALKREITELEKRRDHVLSVCEVTMKEAVVGSGFYHGDLHAGNIMVTDKKATVIDFGNAVRLTKSLRKWITGLSVSAMAGDSALFMESFEAILKEEKPDTTITPEQKTNLTTEFRRILAMGTEADMGQRMMVCMLKAQDMGFMIPTSVYNFAQGQMRLMNTVNEMNKKISRLQETIGELRNLNKADFDMKEVLPGNPEKDYCSVMQKIVAEKTFLIKLSLNVGADMSKKLARAVK